MRTIAFITAGNPLNQKGMFNNIHERASRLLKNTNRNFKVDCYMIRRYDSKLFSIIRNKKRIEQKRFTIIDHVTYRNLWVKHDFFDYLLTTKFKKRSIGDKNSIKKHIHNFSNYDLILAHGPDANYLAYEAERKNKTPYIASWHGSEINISAFKNKYTFNLFKEIIETAHTNFFVSKALLNNSDKITSLGNKEVFYTGPAEYFQKYEREKICKIKKSLDVKEQKIVGFIGNFVPVKNIKVLPEIFKRLNEYDSSIQFWFIGDGKLERKLRKGIEAYSSNCLFFGKLEPKEIPDILNCMNILVLPSLNEGLPRVSVEALACGVNMVGSDVGGIKEVIGIENVFTLNDSFIDKIVNRIIEIIDTDEKPKLLPEKFSWNIALNRLIQLVENYK